MRWTPEQYADYQRTQERAQTPAKKARRKLPLHAFALPLSTAHYCADLGFLHPLPNTWQRMHFMAKKRMMQQIAAAIAVRAPGLVGLQVDPALVSITRFSATEPDPDAVSFVKPILDAMQALSKRHPYGIGAIIDDSSRNIRLETRWIHAPRKVGTTRVEVTQLTQGEL